MRDICPFCERDSSLTILEFEEGSWAVTCNDCGAAGPTAISEQEALDRWHSASNFCGLRHFFVKMFC